MSGFIASASLALDISNVSIQLAGHEIQWQWWALAGFIMFAGFMTWMVIGLWQDPARIEVRKDYLKQHLEAVKDLISQWMSEIDTPIISQIGPEFSRILVPSSEGHPLFDSLKQHLPNQNIWKDYESWKATLENYIDLCKSFRIEIRRSWTIKEIKIARDFELPIMRLLAGEDKELRYQLMVGSDHSLSELKYQVLNVNYTDVLKNAGITSFLAPLSHEQCREETLPREYQTIADHSLKSGAARELMRLYEVGRHLGVAMQESLQNMLLSAEHSKHTCEYCRK
jgi:hypothetical protein